MTTKNLDRAVEKLRAILARVRNHEDFQKKVEARDEVIQRYQPIFSPAHLPHLSEEDFRSFLYLENNKHWTGLYRRGSAATADMETLRLSLATLLDESQPLAQRFDETLKRVHGMGKALATAILYVAYPDRYGVWNNTSESALKILGVWPDFERGLTQGEKYQILNDMLTRMAKALDVDLWTLDWLLWYATQEEENPEGAVLAMPEEETALRFRLEEHLHDFLASNWEHIPLGEAWDIYQEDDEPVGIKYPTGVGQIDILARHKTEPKWLVIELKRGRSADQAMGQVLRYMGWVKRHLADPDGEVLGMIIAPEVDKKLWYAREAVGPSITLVRYKMHFSLEEVKGG